ncbi:capsular exopolysaccharide synthesis family protein [Clostridium acetobutylicum]|uniref:non-specific protein-tyrosine kinase n=1 Tax=Clostridium acetobutylicum (strain ATCC 824 / DSM 792 / JCM 1419 / IAM 19013 / LMG 5710 / NBRC 13948 / NRRL B-527 / VKM B-1787 / 2291 / W) TaxID=272562 RepID=Q97ER8_CLOAB|nr:MULTISPECIES: CpsD/CapB family tyrosine-protein kinase [Clostridium]AAK80980.1 CPSC/CAPB subfamily ATPase [Clostridium acetobutylicum ATCC 824]ADZ22083.1 CPSC/CAPB subfamily ATPase [Clostridium acetobutylicum EA 2018]AEI34396.1 CPSC/ subfamily ATPase [Clostridium acetobutylicum DSM 1731]AWV78609.1 capsular biosynthesis protein [Clostridium acetobutylicum]MBC2393469.1 CpsD/CapB family tyrosine-protein kinase [Clostridium acetobutylicum]
MLIVKDNPKSPVAESYRTLRSNIQFSSFDEEIRVILVTSSGPGEGKSTTAANLALAMAETGNQVLIVDCDLRKPSIHKKFKLSNSSGLSNIIAGQAKFEDSAHYFNKKLCVLTSGKIPPNPAEMLASHKMKEFLNESKGVFKYIILDTPPIIAVTDPQILSTMVDGVILVVSSGVAEIEAAKRAKELLENVNANILGTVLNKVKVGSRGYYSYYGNEGKRGKRRKRKRKLFK